MKTLSNLKADCLNVRMLAENYPDNKTYQIAYEKAQRAVQAKEREVFCKIKGPK